MSEANQEECWAVVRTPVENCLWINGEEKAGKNDLQLIVALVQIVGQDNPPKGMSSVAAPFGD